MPTTSKNVSGFSNGDVIAEVVHGVAAAGKALIPAAGLVIDELDVTALSVGGVAVAAVDLSGVTASAAELNLCDGSIAGTAVASKMLAIGADKNVDVLAVLDLKLGAGAGTSVVATAAELNLANTAVAGTAVASKFLALGANKNVDVLAIADGGFRLGAAAGTVVGATAAEINNMCDQSAGVQAVVAAGAITADGTINRATLSGAAYAVTLAVPGAAAVGKFLCIEYRGGDTDAVTMALTNVVGGSQTSSASFNADGEALLLFGLADKWLVIKEFGVTLS